MEVPLSNVVLARFQPVATSGQEDALSLTTGFRLNYECFGFAGVKLLLKTL